MRLSISFFLLIVSFCSCDTKKLSDVYKDSINRNDSLANQLMTLWETGDTLKTHEIFLTECSYVDVANNFTFSGIDGVNQYVSHIHNWASDVKMTVRKIKITENMGYVEWTMNAKHTSPIEGKVPIATNKDIILTGVTLLEIKDGKIRKASDYMDVLGFVMQLGSKLELPGGVVIGGKETASMDK